jgi:D-psicose/D-tagatose/L-ribulose 3-epimerase
MKLSISNIAWDSADDETVYALAKKHGYQGIDIAPSRIWERYTDTTEEERTQFVRTLKRHGLGVAGMQSLLYNHPELTLFESEEARGKTIEHLKRIIDLGSSLNATALVFGSPKNRIRGEETEEKREAAYTFFKILGDYAHEMHVRFCIEANPTIYGGDYLTHTEEVGALIEEINSPGLYINFDMGTVIENREDVTTLFERYGNRIGHVQISMPKLAPVVLNQVHERALHALGMVAYTGWITIEMVRTDGEERVVIVEKALRDVAEIVSEIGS